jgi:hypothetical protein
MPTLKPTEHKDFNLILDRTFAGFTSTLEKVDGFNISLFDIPVSDQGSSSSPGGDARDDDVSPPASPVGAAQIQDVPPNASQYFAATLIFPDLYRSYGSDYPILTSVLLDDTKDIFYFVFFFLISSKEDDRLHPF